MKLSPEIVSEIFNNFSTTMTIHNPQLYPWFLGQICAGWRNVFLSPSIRYIEVDVHKTRRHSATYFDRALDVLNFCLKCSEGCPLSFTFRMGTDYYAGEYAYVVDILNALITESMRWVTAEFLSLPIIELRRLRCVKGRIPLLRSFALRHRTIKPVQEVITNVFDQAPTLKRLLLSDINVSKFHWASIESFRLGSLTGAASGKLVAALSQATSLKELEIGWEDIHYSQSINVDMEDTGKVTLPSLKRLALHAHNIFEALTTPGLEHLAVNFQSGRNLNQNKTSISSFFNRSFCPLKHLSLRHADTEVTVEVLSRTPGLSSLLLHDYREDNIRRAIKFLNCDMPEGASLMVPRLKSLEIEIPRAELNILSTELSAMVASRARNPGVDGLQELSLRTDSAKPSELTILQGQCEQHNVKLTVGRLGRSTFPIF